MKRPYILSEAAIRGDTLSLDLWYPPYSDEKPNPEEPSKVEIGIVSVRAADSIRVSYDYARDGYVIEQAARFTFRDQQDNDPEWREVAFVQAWARQRPDCDYCGITHRENDPPCPPL